MTNNGLNGSTGATLFRYVRPTFDGYGFGDQPDKRVRQQLDVVVKELAKGFHDIDTRRNQAQYEALKRQLAYLEDEDANGLNQVRRMQQGAGRKLGEVDKQRTRLRNELTRLTDMRDQLRRRPVSENDDDNDNAVEGTVTGEKAASTTGKATKKDIDTKIDQVREKLVHADNEYIDVTTALNNADIEYQAKLDKIKLDLVEVKRKIQAEETPPGPEHYVDVFDLSNFMNDKVQAGRIRFQNKIGSNPHLHGLYVVVEDRLQKARLPFNASLFFAEEDLLRFAFLRAFYVDGLRDAEAIAERVMDADEGGTKHIYDFIVAQMVKRDLRDRKLI